MTKNQRHTLAVKNGRAGGKARVAAIRRKGSEQMRFNMLRSMEHQKAIYAGIFTNRSGIERVNKARLQARKSGARAANAARAAKKAKANERGTRGDAVWRPPRVELAGPAVYVRR